MRETALSTVLVEAGHNTPSANWRINENRDAIQSETNDVGIIEANGVTHSSKSA